MASNSYADFTQALIDDFRAHGGHASGGPFEGRDLLLLTAKGARSGETRTTPLTYSRDGDNFVIVGSKSGADTHPSWYWNLRADPHATIEVGDETIPVIATEADSEERRRLYDAHAELNPVFGGYEAKTTRVIPVFLLTRAG